jgi:hypothetical protein
MQPVRLETTTSVLNICHGVLKNKTEFTIELKHDK